VYISCISRVYLVHIASFVLLSPFVVKCAEQTDALKLRLLK